MQRPLPCLLTVIFTFSSPVLPLPPSTLTGPSYVLKDLMRDWSEEGAEERTESYGRITAELQRLFAGWPAARPPPAVLVPGAGLGRLCAEVAALVRVGRGGGQELGSSCQTSRTAAPRAKSQQRSPRSPPLCITTRCCFSIHPPRPFSPPGLPGAGQRVLLLHAACLLLCAQLHRAR